MKRGLPLVGLALALAACADAPTTPTAAVSTAPPSAEVAPFPSAGAGRDLGVLPGETKSEATLITDDGVVYGTSGSRFFRWTEATGMVEVSSIPAAPAEPPIPAGAPPRTPNRDEGSFAANAKGEATGAVIIPDVSSSRQMPFRWSASEGIRPLDPAFFKSIGLFPPVGLSINRWGHVLVRDRDLNGYYGIAFWSPVTDAFGAAVGGGGATGPFVPLRDDDVVYRHQGFNDNMPMFRALARSPHFAGDGEVALTLPPGTPTAPPGGPGSCFNHVGPASVEVRSNNNNFQAVGFARLECGSFDYRRAVLWDLRGAERPRATVAGAATVVATAGTQTGVPYVYTPNGSTGPWTVRVDWGDQSAMTSNAATAQGYGVAGPHTYAKPGTYFARAYVVDALGAFGVHETVVTVAAPEVNRPPVIANLRGFPEGRASYPLNGNVCYSREQVCIKYTLQDEDAGDAPFTTTVNWGDGTAIVPNTIPAQNISLLAYHRYAAAGTYTVTVTATDRRGASSAKTMSLTIAP